MSVSRYQQLLLLITFDVSPIIQNFDSCHRHISERSSLTHITQQSTHQNLGHGRHIRSVNPSDQKFYFFYYSRVHRNRSWCIRTLIESNTYYFYYSEHSSRLTCDQDLGNPPPMLHLLALYSEQNQSQQIEERERERERERGSVHLKFQETQNFKPNPSFSKSKKKKAKALSQTQRERERCHVKQNSSCW